MKKILITLLIVPFLLNLCEAAISITPSVSPTTIYPGDQGVITLTLNPTTNYASSSVSVSSTEITLDRSSVSLGSMFSGSARSATFKFTAPQEAGFYIVSFSVKGDSETYNQVVNVQVLGEAQFSITRKTPEKLYAGEEKNLTFTIRNTGYKDIDRAKFTLITPQNFAILDNSEKIVENLAIDGEKNISFNIRIDRDVTLMSYPFSMVMQVGGHIDYENFSMPVLGVPLLELAGINIDPAKPTVGSDLTLAVRLENLGTSRARSVDMEMTSPAFSGIKVDYVGSIDSDDISSAIFELVPLFIGTHTIEFDISYIDDSGNSHNIQKSINIPIYESNGVDSTLLYLVILVLVVIIIYLWRRK